MSEKENKAVIQSIFKELLIEGKTDKIDGLIADDYVYHGPGGYEFKGKEGLKKFMIWLKNSFPTLNLTIDDLIAEGDKVVTYFTMTGADKRNKQFNVQGVVKSLVAGGKEVETWEILDRFEIASQLAPGWAKAILNLIEKQSTKGRP